jgi:hypothetical protein
MRFYGLARSRSNNWSRAVSYSYLRSTNGTWPRCYILPTPGERLIACRNPLLAE